MRDTVEAMTSTDPTAHPLVVVTGANGLVGAATCRALLERGAQVRGVVRREGTAPSGVEEVVGEFHDGDVAAAAVAGAAAVVSTVHPLAGDLATQHRVAVEGTPVLARAALQAGVDRFVHVSTAAVYDRSPGTGDVDEHGTLVGDDGGDYPVTKRDTDLALAAIDGLTTVLLRPPAILGAGESSIWNSVRPARIRDDAEQRSANPEASFAWVHVDDLARIAADVAIGVVAASSDPEQGPVEGACTPLNVAGEPAAVRAYHQTVTDALGVEPTWEDGEVWTGAILADRARRWGWSPQVDLESALRELGDGLR